MHDIHLLRRLREKLSIGNRRAIHLNALPGNLLNRLDAMQLALLDPHMPARFLNTLLTKPQFQFTASYQRSDKSIDQLSDEERQELNRFTKRADAIFFETNDHRLEYGVDAFGFGFPLLIKRDRQQPDKIIKAPVFIWRLQYKKVGTRAFQWQISRDHDQAAYVNPLLLSHLEADEGISLRDFRSEFSEDNFLDENMLLDVCNKLLASLQADNEYPQVTITYCPGNDTLKHVDFDKPRLRWAGVFGLFKVPKQAIVADLDALIKQQQQSADRKYQDNNNAAPQNNKHVLLSDIEDVQTSVMPSLLPQKAALTQQVPPFAALPTDPAQQEILHRLNHYPRQIIQGPPGTGKSQSLTAILTAAAAAGLRCLVICEKRTALEVLQQNLATLGLSSFCALIEDIDRDRNNLVEQVRHHLDNAPALPDFSHRQYEVAIQQAEFLREKINKQHHFLAKALIDTHNWTDVVGLYLQKEAIQSKEILNKCLYLKSSLLDYVQEEYQRLLQVVLAGQPLFEQIGLREHPLEQLNSAFFTQQTSGEAYFSIEKISRQLFEECSSLQRRMAQFIKQYAESIALKYYQYDALLDKILPPLNEILARNLREFGDDFSLKHGFKAQFVKLMASVLPKYKKISSAQQSALSLYQELQVLHKNCPYVNYTFTQNTDNPDFTFSALRQEITNFAAMQQRRKQQHTAIIAQWVEGLHPNYLHPNSEAAGYELEQLLQQHRRWVRQVTDSTLLQKLPALDASEYAATTAGKNNDWNKNEDKPLPVLVREMQLLEAVLSGIVHTLPDFKPYYQWRHFYESADSTGQMLLNALTLTKPRLWREAFESWYFNWLLVRREPEELPHNDLKIQQLQQQTDALMTMQAAKIWNKWHSARRLAITAFNSRNAPFNAKRLYNKRGNKDYKRSTLRQIVQADFDLFTSFFPIVLANPVVCSSLFPLQEGLFDLVIFDEASQLRLEDTYCALLRGKCCVVSGDAQQMPPSDYFLSHQSLVPDEVEGDETETDSLLPDNDADLAEQESLLEYAENKGYSRSFLDFHYRSQHPCLIDFSNAAFYGNRLVPMPAAASYQAIRFVAVNGVYDRKINEAEADKVIHILLHEIRPDAAGHWPSVGVATFNLYQRNYILSKLQALKSEGDTVAANIIVQLEINGLFVKNLENIQGDERDIMLLSTTFGRRPDGKFLQFFGPLNQAKGYRLLNVIITRAKKMLYVLCSIPPDFYGRYAQELEGVRSGRTYLYAYLAYAQAIEAGNEELRQQILSVLARHSSEAALLDIFSGQPAGSAGATAVASGVFVARVAHLLGQELPAAYKIRTDASYGGFKVRIVVEPPLSLGKPIAIEPDNAPQHAGEVAYMHDIYRQKQLTVLGFRVVRIYSANWWLNETKELMGLLKIITEKESK